MPGEKEAAPPFMCVLNCCHKQRPGFISLGILEEKAAPAPITMLVLGKGSGNAVAPRDMGLVDLGIF